MYYVVILKNNNGQIEIGYTEINPEINLKMVKEEKGTIYYKTYQDEKEAIRQRDSLKIYGRAWAQLKRRIERSLR